MHSVRQTDGRTDGETDNIITPMGDQYVRSSKCFPRVGLSKISQNFL